MTKAKVNSVGLKLHAGPAQKEKVLDELQFDDEVEFVSNNLRNGWIEVRVCRTRTGAGIGEMGWMASKYLTVLPRKAPDAPAPKLRPVPVQDEVPDSMLMPIMVALGSAVIIIGFMVLLWKFVDHSW